MILVILVITILIVIAGWFVGNILMDVFTYRDLQRKLRKEKEKNE